MIRVCFLLILITVSMAVSARTYEEVTFLSGDSLPVTADLYHVDKEAPTIMMFHQSASSRGEYRDIAPGLQRMGFNCIAVDLRWGKQDFWNHVPNETAERNGTYPVIDNYIDSEEYRLNQVWPIMFDAYNDMEATIGYLSEQDYNGEMIVMGSSFSAMLIFKLAAENKRLDGLLAFSPGEYYPADDTLLTTWARKLDIPVFLCAGESSDELEMVASVSESLNQDVDKTLYQSKGRHGASVLINNGDGMKALYRFLERYQPAYPDQIGYRILNVLRPDSRFNDEGSVEDDPSGKPIPVHLWYPLDHFDDRASVKYSDYIGKISIDRDSAANVQLFVRIAQGYADLDSVDQESLLRDFQNVNCKALDSPDLPANELPLVMICGGVPFQHLELAELLAGSGFIVASFPRLGMKKGERLAYEQPGGEEYRKDLSFVISHLSGLPFVKSDRHSFVTWGYEGAPALEYAAASENTAVFISFDSSIGYDYGRDLLSDPGAISSTSSTFPVHHYTGPGMDYGKDLSMLNEMKTEWDHICVDTSVDMPHADFTSIGSIAMPKFLGTEPESRYIILSSLAVDLIRLGNSGL